MRGLDNILINRVAPLCPIVYLKLRSLCRKYRNALPVPEFVLWMRYYTNPSCEPFFPDTLKREFVVALYPILQRCPEVVLVDTPCLFPDVWCKAHICIALPRADYRDPHLYALKCSRFNAYTCMRYCRLMCCTHLIDQNDHWTLSIHYDRQLFMFYYATYTGDGGPAE